MRCKIISSYLALPLLFAVLLSATLKAEIKLPTLLCDNMVLQQNTIVKIWGDAKPDSKVIVTPSWSNKTYSTQSDSDGHWQVQLPTGAAGGPYTLTISDGAVLVLRDVLLGEVWICSGQSNMAMPMRGYYGQHVAGSTNVIAKASLNQNIRIFNVEEVLADAPQSSCGGLWLKSSPETVSEFSATAYYFGLSLRQHMPDVPIGLLCSSYGGSTIEAWIGRGELEALTGIDKTITYGYEPAHKRASVLYNGMIAPIINYAARGFIWYQGEANTENHFDYAKLMECMVAQWRAEWTSKDMPFYFVQLAQWSYGDNNGIELPLTVEAQLHAQQLIPNSAIAPTTDLGDMYTIHPPHKDVVGYRLALLALSKTYGMTGVPCEGPRFRSAKVVDREGSEYVSSGKKVVVDFDGIPFGLMFFNQIYGFEIAAQDRVFVPAMAHLTKERDQIELYANQVKEPRYIRYAFRNYIETNLYNTAALPAMPFRTTLAK